MFLAKPRPLLAPNMIDTANTGGFRDYCAHVAEFYDARALSLINASSGFDAAWEKAWRYNRLASRGRVSLFGSV